MEANSKNLQLGQNVVIEEGVTIGENVSIGHNTVILSGTEIGDNVIIGCNCVLGVKPGGNKRMRRDDYTATKLIIGDGTKIGNLVSIYSGTSIGEHCFVGDHASIRENVTIGNETVVGRAAIVELNTKIGSNVTIQTLVYVTGDTIVEDNVFFGPCVSMSNDKYMGLQEYELKGPHFKRNVKVGNNAPFLPNVTIGEDAVVGAGSVVTKDVNAGDTVVGVPAKKMK
ncbi:MAG: N-acetyltransferase [Lysinibacillus sp.]|nr:N-acetyltransferase [Lysinibacillus sp.]